MEDGSSPLVKPLMELLDTSTTPEQALQSFSSFCFSPVDYVRDNEHRMIFIAHVKFIMTRLTDACVDGILEDILKKTIMYSKMFYPLENANLVRRRMHEPFVYGNVWPTEDQAASWLNEALSSTSNCPNPYIRLELFRLIRIFLDNSSNLAWHNICDTFIQTIGEIQPSRLYPSANMDEMLFGVCDMQYIFDMCGLCGKFKNIISTDIVDGNSKEARFITHCLQLLGVFSVLAGSLRVSESFQTNERVSDSYITQIRACYSVLRSIGLRVTTFQAPILGKFSLKKLCQWIVCHPLFHLYVSETFCDLTSAIINNKVCNTYTTLYLLDDRDSIAGELGVCTKTCDLPRLLMYREMQGSTRLVRQHSLLLRNISPFSIQNVMAT
ncbi:unnamed protein product [Meganyctiphanes norvegica]|uniref:Uncharacterized protein n=1 Tax=Meganyctiphanes norvegica TaxID=48144 RepID=A0AAV2S9H5_MEGNR